MKASIIIPVHNRKTITLRCLERLDVFGVFELCDVIVVDDGSTDGTAQAIAEHFPQVQILQGDGNLWWGGAIKKGMQQAIAAGADYLIWLNDDVIVQAETISALLNRAIASPKRIVGGLCLSSASDRTPSYGGIKKISPHQLARVYEGECDGLAGNLVCMPSTVVEAIGYPNTVLTPHYYGDVIYTYRVKREGYRLWIETSALAFCEDTNHNATQHYSLKRAFVQLLNKKYASYWLGELTYEWTFWGVYGLLHYFARAIIVRFTFLLLVATISYVKDPSSIRSWFKTRLKV